MSLEGGRNKVAANFTNMSEPNMTSQRDTFTETCVHLKNCKKEQSTDFSGFTGVLWQGRDGQYWQKPSVNCMGVKYLIVHYIFRNMFSSVWTDSGKSQKLSKEVRERISLKDLCLEGCRIKVL